MDIFELFATDPSKEDDGVWHHLDKVRNPEARVKVARMANDRYNSRLQELRLQPEYEMYVAQEGQELTEGQIKRNREIVRTTMRKAMAHAVLVDFEGLKYKGKPLEYSEENAEMLLTHMDFMEVIYALANDAANYRFNQEAKAVKNS